MARKLSLDKGSLFDDTPRGVLEALLIGGAIVVTLSTAPMLLAVLGAIGYVIKEDDKARRQKLYTYASYLKRRKYLAISPVSRGRVRVSLTSLGRERALNARAKRILSMPIARPKMWDYRWRLILFDIAADERMKRNAFRAFIKKIGAVMLQKSVWIHPFDCSEHVQVLRDYFNLTDNELRLVLATDIGDESSYRKHFNL